MKEDIEYFLSEGFKNILHKYEQSVRSGQSFYMDADDLADIADYYHYQGQLEEAERAITLAQQLNPDAVGPVLYKAREALSRNDFETARSYAERIRYADSTEYLFLQGEILICEKKIAEADQLFREYFMQAPADDLQDYVYNVANLYHEYQLHEKAFEWMARSKGDDGADFKELMARTLFGLGKYKDSERLFNELIDRDPYSKRYWNALANSQFMCEEYEAAITSSEYAMAIDPNDAESILTKANGLFRLGNYEKALSYFRKYSEKADADEFGHLHQGSCLISLGRFEEAAACYEKALAIAPVDSLYLPEIYQELAFAYCELGKVDEALHAIDMTETLDCDHSEMEVIRGHILISNDRFEEAEKTFKHAILSSDNALGTMLRITVSLYDNHLTDAAYELFKKLFLRTDDEWRNGFAYMALCCWELEHYEEFMEYLQKAVTKNPEEARQVLGGLFPENLPVEGYYEYMQRKINNEQP